MKVATREEMRLIDQQAIENYGISGLALMENAGSEVARKVEELLGSVQNKRICFLLGKGNNGGDGFVAARHLLNQGAKIKVFLFSRQSEVTGDAKSNLETLAKMQVVIIEVSGERDWDKLKLAASFSDCLVDGLVGTGFHGELSGSMAKAATIVNDLAKPVVAIDIPSGVDANTGQVSGVAIKAACTVTFGLAKLGLLIYPGASFAGEIYVADIGLPVMLLDAETIKQNLSTALLTTSLLPKRDPNCHKGMAGKVFVLAGCKGFTGAAALAAQGALKAGAGLVTLGVPASLNDIMEVKLTEVMTKPLPEIGGALNSKAVSYVLDFAANSDVLAIGPGLGRHEETCRAVRELVTSAESPLVLDADALYALAETPDILTQCQALPIITPHPGEMSRLTGLPVAEINSNRIELARKYAVLWNTVLVLKGARTIVAFPDGDVYINTTGNAGMATGGMGDVLTGIIAALIAQGLSSQAAAIAGVYLHGMAADIVARSGMVGLTAVDVLNALPAAICGIQG